MSRRFIATIAATAVALTSFFSTPARADGDDVARTLAAIVGLAIVGAAIKDARDDKKKKRVVTQHHYKHHNNHVTHNRQSHVTHNRQVLRHDSVRPRPLPPRVSRHLLPGECLFSFPTRDGRARIFGERCLNRSYAHTRSLPRECHRQIRTRNGPRYGYSARCLNNRGYQLAHR